MASQTQKQHLICIPTPAQGHINAMFHLIKLLLHTNNFHITLVLTEFDFSRISSSTPSAFQGIQGLDIETIPDDLPKDSMRGLLDLSNLLRAFHGVLKEGFRGVLKRLLNVGPISCIVSDWFNEFSYQVGVELGVRVSLLVTTAACGLFGFMYYDELVNRGYFPLKDESCLTNGFLDTPVDWIPGLIKGITLRHVPTFFRSTDPNDVSFRHSANAAKTCFLAESIIFNTFDDLEPQVLAQIKTKIPNIFTIGPLSLLSKQVAQHELLPLKSSRWKEDASCFQWLNNMSPGSVIYVNYGSLVVLTYDQLKEFAWGLANSNHPFLWVIRSDLVEGGSDIINEEYLKEIEGRGLISGWCPQEKVLEHSSIGAFLTHSGWNSTLDSISAGVPMICWPFFGEQQINSLYVCREWEIGVEMEEGEVRRERVEELVREVMEGEKGRELKRNALEWKKKAEEATRVGGSSYNGFEKLVKYLKENK